MLIAGNNNTPSVKLVMLGNSGVGKSSLLNMWITGSPLASPKPTIGAANHMQRLPIGDEEIDLFVWDTAGQEQFAILSPLYVRSTDVAIIVADITEEESFKKIESWKKIVVDTNNQKTPIVLAVNKIDLGVEVFPQQEIKEKYDAEFAGVFFVSAAKGTNVEELFYAAAKNGLKYVEENKNKEKQFIISIPSETKKKKSGCC